MSGVCAVVGGQFGSEGKGLIVGHIAKGYDTHVRVGAANAGHTIWVPKQEYRVAVTDPGDHTKDVPMEDTHEKHVLQQIPCAAYANPSADLFIGPGALISPTILHEEVDRLNRWRRMWGMLTDKPIVVDARAHVITNPQIEDEAATDLAERIGSTSTIAREGIGQAQADRVMRADRCLTAAHYFTVHHDETCGPDDFYPFQLRDVPMTLANPGFSDADILLEGTQGASLSLTTGTHPWITSRNTTAAGLCADVGIAPGRLSRVILVVRTFPIRVAGNSGAFWFDSNEIEWEDISVDPETERTTVTKKVRRVATFSFAQLEESVKINGATEIALTFTDYLHPDFYDRSGTEELSDLQKMGYGRIVSLVNTVEDVAGVPVTMLGTGPRTVVELTK